MNVVEVKNLSKSYKNLKAVDNVSFNVKKGKYLDFWVLMEVVKVLQLILYFLYLKLIVEKLSYLEK